MCCCLRNYFSFSAMHLLLNYLQHGSTALVSATLACNLEIVSLLLDRGADVNASEVIWTFVGRSLAKTTYC